MQLTLPDDAIRQTGLTDQQYRIEVAAVLYQNDLVTLRGASAMAGIPELELCDVFIKRGIALYYDVDDLEQDLKSLANLKAQGLLK